MSVNVQVKWTFYSTVITVMYHMLYYSKVLHFAQRYVYRYHIILRMNVNYFHNSNN